MGALLVQLAALAMIAATAAAPLTCPPAPALSPAPAPQARFAPPPPAACTAAAPARGASFTGTVLQVIDGHTLCVAFGPSPDQWVRVRLADASSGLPRGALMAAAFAREITCVAGATDGEGLTAVCTLDGRSVGEAAALPDAAAQAANWR
jgi:glucose/arabinose dehydrogenase